VNSLRPIARDEADVLDRDVVDSQRFVALLLPLAVGRAVFPRWLQPPLVVGLFFVLELIAGWVMESWLYGQAPGYRRSRS